MCIRFILLLTVAIIAAQAEKISPATIKSDATKLAKSYRVYLESLPGSMIKDLEAKRCPWMLKCCPEELAHFFPLMTEKTFEKNCIASSGDKLTGSGSTTCKKAIEEFSQSTDPKYGELSSALIYTPAGFYAIEKWSEQIDQMCPAKELQAFYCESARMEAFLPCIEKTLEPFAREDDGKHYSKFITDLDNELTTVMKKFQESVRKN